MREVLLEYVSLTGALELGYSSRHNFAVKHLDALWKLHFRLYQLLEQRLYSLAPNIIARELWVP